MSTATYPYCMLCGGTLESPAGEGARPVCAGCSILEKAGQRPCPSCKNSVKISDRKCPSCGGVLAFRPQLSPWAVLSLAMGIAGFGCMPLLGGLAFLYGTMAIRQIRRSDGSLGGLGLAQWGRGLGIAWLAISLVLFVLILIPNL